MNVSRKEFQIERTPQELQEYMASVNHFVEHDPELVKLARLKKEPYKTFDEELRPFSAFCSWKYRNRTDVTCSLLSENSAGDALVQDHSTGKDHLIEITWPMNGKKAIKEGQQLNEKGMTDGECWDFENNIPLREIVNRVLSIAQKKLTRDYRTKKGMSTLLFVFSEWRYYDDDNPKDQAVLNELVQKLKLNHFKVDNVVVLLVQSNKFIEVKTSNVVSSLQGKYKR